MYRNKARPSALERSSRNDRARGCRGGRALRSNAGTVFLPRRVCHPRFLYYDRRLPEAQSGRSLCPKAQRRFAERRAPSRGGRALGSDDPLASNGSCVNKSSNVREEECTREYRCYWEGNEIPPGTEILGRRSRSIAACPPFPASLAGNPRAWLSRPADSRNHARSFADRPVNAAARLFSMRNRRRRLHPTSHDGWGARWRIGFLSQPVLV